MCDTACINHWVSKVLTDTPVFFCKAMKLAVMGINTEKVIDTKLVELSVKQRDNSTIEPFKFSPDVKEYMIVGADVININAFKKHIRT